MTASKWLSTFLTSLFVCATAAAPQTSKPLRYSFVNDLTLSYSIDEPTWVEGSDPFIRMKSVPRAALSLSHDVFLPKWDTTIRAGTVFSLAQSEHPILCTLHRVREITGLGGGRYVCFIDFDRDNKFDGVFVRGSDVLWGTLPSKVGTGEFVTVRGVEFKQIDSKTVADEIGIAFLRNGHRLTVCRTWKTNVTDYCLGRSAEVKITTLPQTVQLLGAVITVESIVEKRALVRVILAPPDQRLQIL